MEVTLHLRQQPTKPALPMAFVCCRLLAVDGELLTVTGPPPFAPPIAGTSCCSCFLHSGIGRPSSLALADEWPTVLVTVTVVVLMSITMDGARVVVVRFTVLPLPLAVVVGVLVVVVVVVVVAATVMLAGTLLGTVVFEVCLLVLSSFFAMVVLVVLVDPVDAPVTVRLLPGLDFFGEAQLPAVAFALAGALFFGDAFGDDSGVDLGVVVVVRMLNRRQGPGELPPPVPPPPVPPPPPPPLPLPLEDPR
uniref:Uncharacterized protein n=1 Tax=Anopheles atroparvus TaxID=41427 RepID=A0A182IW19_ANOAO